jgi:hypothetical protein
MVLHKTITTLEQTWRRLRGQRRPGWSKSLLGGATPTSRTRPTCGTGRLRYAWRPQRRRQKRLPQTSRAKHPYRHDSPPAARGVYPAGTWGVPCGTWGVSPGDSDRQFITGLVIMFSPTEKVGTGTGYRVMKRTSRTSDVKGELSMD